MLPTAVYCRYAGALTPSNMPLYESMPARGVGHCRAAVVVAQKHACWEQKGWPREVKGSCRFPSWPFRGLPHRLDLPQSEVATGMWKSGVLSIPPLLRQAGLDVVGSCETFCKVFLPVV